MTSRQTNILLTGSALSAAIAAIAIVVTAFLVPINSIAEENTSIVHPTSEATAVPSTEPAGMDRLFARTFRNTLDDPAASPKVVASATPTAVASPLQVNLIGTIGTSVAMFRLADGSLVARVVGEQIDGAEIVRIEPASVALHRNGQSFSIAKPAAADPSTGLIVIR